MMGWSCGMVLLSSLILVSFYFEKRRSLANAIAMCGGPIGAAVLSPFGSILLRSFGWQITFRIFGGINFCTSVAALLLKPLELMPIPTEVPEEYDHLSECEEQNLDKKDRTGRKCTRTLSELSLIHISEPTRPY